MKKQYIIPMTMQVVACPQNILLSSGAPKINVGGEGSNMTADAPKRVGIMYI